MIYGGVISTPKNTAASAPQVTVFSVTEGIVYHLKVSFPPGPSGLLHVQVWDAAYLVFPTGLGESFVGDDELFQFDVLYAKKADPFIILVKTWNLDDTYAHEVSVWLSMETADEFKARYLPMMQTNALVTQIGEQELAQSAARRQKLAAFMETLPEGEGV